MIKQLFFSFLIIFTISCNDQSEGPGGIGEFSDVDMDDVYLDYRVTGEEGDDKLNIMLQFREEAEDGPTLVVGEAGRVELDGEILKADSSGLTGAYYEVQKPIDGFAGKHRIVLYGPDNKQFVETFSFSPMVLRTPLSDIMRRGDWVLELDGLESTDYVRIVMTDTSFSNEGINRLDTVFNGRLLISRNDLEELHNGDIHMELYHEIERPTRQDGKAGGKFYMTYVVKRDFNLQD